MLSPLKFKGDNYRKGIIEKNREKSKSSIEKSPNEQFDSEPKSHIRGTSNYFRRL